MDRWEGKVALVTGASSGIGAAIVEQLAKKRILVIGLARRLDRLEKLSESLEEVNGKFYPRQCDVRKEEELLDAFKWVNSEFGGVDILVNNAGVVSPSKIIDDDIDSFRKILDVNVLATAICIREAVASLKSRDADGYIININSILGHYLPGFLLKSSLYAPSKFAITALTETVRKELAAEGNTNIKITSVSPGLVKTEIIEASGSTAAKLMYERCPHLDAKDIADTVIYLLSTPKKVQVSEITIRPIGEE